jgi:Molybdopterin-binding domain of aldehyde dehydrogenase
MTFVDRLDLGRLVDRLGVDPEQVKFIQGDTDAVAFGMGTGGSRPTTMSGGAIVMVSEKNRSQGQEARGPLPRSRRGRRGIQGRPLHHCRHRLEPRHPRGGEHLDSHAVQHVRRAKLRPDSTRLEIRGEAFKELVRRSAPTRYGPAVAAFEERALLEVRTVRRRDLDYVV